MLVYIEDFLVSETAKTRPGGRSFNIAEFFPGMLFACNKQVLLYPVGVEYLEDSQALQEWLWVLCFGISFSPQQLPSVGPVKAHNNLPVQPVLPINVVLAELLALI